MPIYELECPNCNLRLELLKSYNDTNDVCPQCGGAMKRLISTLATVNHTFGWKMSEKFYETPGMDDREGLVKNV